MSSLSAIVTTFNRPDYLDSAVKSVINQTRAVDEIIVIDDSDRTQRENKAVIKSFDDPRIILIATSGCIGSNPARNLGVKAAKGDYLAFLDDDDQWLPNKVERQAAVLDADSTIGMVYCGWNHFNLDTGEIREHPPREFPEGDLFNELIFKNVTGKTSGFMSRKSSSVSIGNFNIELPASQDWEYALRMSKAFKIGVVPQPEFLFGGHSGQRITRSTGKYLQSYEHIYQQYASHRRKVRGSLARSALIKWKLGGFMQHEGRLAGAFYYRMLGFFSNPLQISRIVLKRFT